MIIEEYADCLKYIDSYWDKIIHRPSHMITRGKIPQLPYITGHQKKDYHIVEIPNAYIVPNDRKFTYIFYWDSYFMFRGLMGTKKAWVMKEMVDNFTYLFNKYQIIPNFNSPASMGRSQPPFLTSMILDVYLSGASSQKKQVAKMLHRFQYGKWFRDAIAVAKREYELVWIDEAGVYNHKVPGFSLSRYGDRDVGYAHSSELESGWDFTSRFYNRCNHFLPIDLNTLLYTYENDFAHVAYLFGDKKEQEHWSKKALERKETINALMWNEKQGFFYDYGWYYKKHSEFLSLAGFFPLWAGLATYEQAEKVRDKLPKFESEYGLTITAKESLARPIDLSKIQRRYHPAIEEIIQPKQWDYPNIWSPLEYITVIGLLRYGFIDDAKRIMHKSITAHSKLFRKYGTFFEKINGEVGEPGVNYHYESQTGFGWTNAVFYRYTQILQALENGTDIFEEKATNQTPPFTLKILH